jgi:hypothetical protein
MLYLNVPEDLVGGGGVVNIHAPFLYLLQTSRELGVKLLLLLCSKKPLRILLASNGGNVVRCCNAWVPYAASLLNRTSAVSMASAISSSLDSVIDDAYLGIRPLNRAESADVCVI